MILHNYLHYSQLLYSKNIVTKLYNKLMSKIQILLNFINNTTQLFINLDLYQTIVTTQQYSIVIKLIINHRKDHTLLRASYNKS